MKIITSEGLTPSMLADEIGIQRSGISHILSGRNYPSFDFMQKLLTRFPQLNAEWLLLGQGSMYKTGTADQPPSLFDPAPIPPQSKRKPTVADDAPVLPAAENVTNVPHGELLPKSLPSKTTKTVEKVIIFYSDNSFTLYTPE